MIFFILKEIELTHFQRKGFALGLVLKVRFSLELGNGLLNFSLTVEPLHNGHLWDRRKKQASRNGLCATKSGRCREVAYVAVSGSLTVVLKQAMRIVFGQSVCFLQFLGSF